MLVNHLIDQKRKQDFPLAEKDKNVSESFPETNNI